MKQSSKACSWCGRTTRRRFIQTTAAMATVPLVATETHSVESDELFLNCSPCRQVLTVEIASVVSAVTGFDFTPRIVGHDEGRRFARMLRDQFGRIRDEARTALVGSPRVADRLAFEWLVGDGAAQRIGWLEAFVRAGSFRIEQAHRFIILSVEL